MESPKQPSASGAPNPLLSLSSFIHHQCHLLGSHLSARLDDTKRFAGTLAATFPSPAQARRPLLFGNAPPFASVAHSKSSAGSSASPTISSGHVAKTLAGTAVYTVSNSDNEFVLVSDPEGNKSIGLLCFRKEDAESFLAQVRLRKKELKGKARVVPLTLDQVYMLKVEGIAFRFLPDPVQIKNAIDMKDSKVGFDGVPVFQSDLLVVKSKNRRYCPVYFQKEDIEQELSKVSRSSKGLGVSQHIMVGTLEDVLKKMETSSKNSGWEDLIFIPPGKSHSQHIQEIAKS